MRGGRGVCLTHNDSHLGDEERVERFGALWAGGNTKEGGRGKNNNTIQKGV
jgi:hypothetical protein